MNSTLPLPKVSQQISTVFVLRGGEHKFRRKKKKKVMWYINELHIMMLRDTNPHTQQKVLQYLPAVTANLDDAIVCHRQLGEREVHMGVPSDCFSLSL